MKTLRVTRAACLALPLVLLIYGCTINLPDISGTVSGDVPSLGGGTKGSKAVEKKQKKGATATPDQPGVQEKGAEADGVTCDDGIDGVAWCDSDTTILFCDAGTWYALDCSQIESEAFCGYDEESNLVDCFIGDYEEGGGGECTEDDLACADDAECCAGVCAEDGFCGEAGGECIEDDHACAADVECCAGVCAADGFCGEVRRECAEDGYECLDDAECCAGVCAEDGYCGEI